MHRPQAEEGCKISLSETPAFVVCGYGVDRGGYGDDTQFVLTRCAAYIVAVTVPWIFYIGVCVLCGQS